LIGVADSIAIPYARIPLHITVPTPVLVAFIPIVIAISLLFLELPFPPTFLAGALALILLPGLPIRTVRILL